MHLPPHIGSRNPTQWEQGKRPAFRSKTDFGATELKTGRTQLDPCIPGQRVTREGIAFVKIAETPT